MNTTTSLLEQVKALSLDEQRALIVQIQDNIRAEQQELDLKDGFKVGDILKFNGGTRGLIFMEVTGFNKARTQVSGNQLNGGLKTGAGTPWKVPMNQVLGSSRLEIGA